MNLRCLCDWTNHEHHPGIECQFPALMYQWYNGKNYQVCPVCIDAVEAYQIVRDAPYDAIFYMGIGKDDTTER